MKKFLVTFVVLLFGLAGCGDTGSAGSDGTAGDTGLTTLMKISDEAVGENCGNGGKKIEIGIDEDRNGKLDTDEINDSATTYLCNAVGVEGAKGDDGSDGATGDPGDDGSDGATGDTGDDGSDGATGDPGDDGSDGATGDPGDNGSDGHNSLIAIDDEVETNCPNGGKRIQSGLDDGDPSGTADDGVLDEGEVDATEYICDSIGNCGDTSDNEFDGWADEKDPDCWDLTAVPPLYHPEYFEDKKNFGLNECNDGIDNEDADSLIDSADPHCENGFDVSELGECEDGVDNDGDGWADEKDTDCWGFSYSPVVYRPGDFEDGEYTWPKCNDGIDNDGDSLIDSDDPSCENGLDDSELDECGDGMDNDGDGWTDEDDIDCWMHQFMPPIYQPKYSENNQNFGWAECNDGIDNDGDLLIDSDDPHCENGLDNSENE